MKINLRTVLLLVGVFLISSGPGALAHTDVTAKQARELIDSTDDLIVIDVRETYEYCDTRGHVPGALNYPWYSGVLKAQYEELPVDSPILVVCGSGSRSNQAATFLDSMDFSMVYDMLGGMGAWTWKTEPCVDSDSKYTGGTGEPNDPYQIATAADLITLGETPDDYDKHFILTDDIDLDPNLPDHKVFDRAVIAPDTNDAESDFQGTPFIGVFDGNDHTISNLAIEGMSYLGLFGRIAGEGEISNLGVVDVNITGSGGWIGGLVGANEWMLTRCHSSGRVSGTWNVGGLVGVNGSYIDIGFGPWLFSSVRNCSSSVTVNGDSLVGGLVGLNRREVTHCYCTGETTGTEHVGGFAGSNDINGSIRTSYSMGFVTGTENVGGLVGMAWGGSVVDSFWNIETSGQIISAGGTGKTTAEMQTADTFLDAGWDFVGETENGNEDIWSICEGTNYPRFIWQIPVVDFVCPDGVTIEDFAFFMEHWLDNNCDLSNGYCDGTDLDQSGSVDVIDLEIFFENWPDKN